MKKYIDRLSNEWKKYGKIVIAVDYDSTISPYHTIENEDDINRTIKVLKECQNVGCYTMIHTCCDSSRYNDIKEYCNSIGIVVDSINHNPIELPFGKEGSKPYYNHSLDDRSALPASLDILEEAMYLQRAYNYSQVQRDEIA